MSGSALRKFILFDANGRELELTTENNVPVAIKDANGLDLELTALSNIPVEILDSNGLNLDLTTESNVPVAVKDANGRDLELTAQDNVPVAIRDVNGLELALESNGAVPVNIQDQFTPTIILPMAQELAATTLAANTIIDAYTIIVTSAAGATIGDHIRIINSAADRYYFGTILNIVTNTITVDTQIDFIYLSGSEVTFSNINMNVNGSVTPVVFKFRTGAPSIPSDLDITRIIITCIADTAVDLSLFGDLPALTRGVVFRTVDGEQRNIFNIKTNLDIASIAYDWTPYAATNPSQGVDGFASRLTFAGQNKIGVVLRVGQDDNLEILVQDDLTGLDTLKIILEGHAVFN